MKQLFRSHPLLDAFQVLLPSDERPGAAADGVPRINNLLVGCRPDQLPSWPEINAAWGFVVCGVLAVARLTHTSFDRWAGKGVRFVSECCMVVTPLVVRPSTAVCGCRSTALPAPPISAKPSIT